MFSEDELTVITIRRVSFLILSLLFFVCFQACQPKQVIMVDIDPSDLLLSKAERMYRSGADEKALRFFDEYIGKKPDSPLIPSVLIKKGRIFLRMENYEGAEAAFSELIEKYPDNTYVPEAELGLVRCDYQKGEYRNVIEAGEAALPEIDTKEHRAEMRILIGNAHLAEQNPKKALDCYVSAYGDSEAIPDKPVLLEKIKTAVSQLSTDEIITYLGDPKESEIKGYLMFQLGRNNLDEDKFEDAFRILASFVKLYPENEYVPDAIRLLERIDKIPLYRRYTVGCLLPLTGAYKKYGEKALKGVQLALSRFGEDRGGPSINIVIKDTQSEPRQALAGLEELYKENVSSIIGPIVTADVVAPEAQKRGVPTITLTQKERINDAGDYIFRNFLTPEMQIEAIVRYSVEVLGIKDFAVMYPDERYGHTFLDLFWKKIIEFGGQIAGVEQYDTNMNDFSVPIRKLTGKYYGAGGKDLELDFDALFIPDDPDKVGLIIPQLAFHDVTDIYLLGTNLWHSEKLLQMAGRYIQYAVIPDGFALESEDPAVQTFISDFKSTFGEPPGFVEAVAYDTAMILFNAVSDPQVGYRSTLKQHLAGLRNFRGVSGETSFTANGDPVKEIYLLSVDDQKFVEIKSPVRISTDDI